MSRKKSVSFKKRIGWYPVSTLGWFITITYLFLLIYVVFKVNTDLYATNIALFRGSILIIGIILLILIWAKFTGDQPFKVKK